MWLYSSFLELLDCVASEVKVYLICGQSRCVTRSRCLTGTLCHVVWADQRQRQCYTAVSVTTGCRVLQLVVGCYNWLYM